MNLKPMPMLTPLLAIRDNRYEFRRWISLIVLLGLIGLWAPLLVEILFPDQIRFLTYVISSCVLATYSVVIVSEGIVNAISAEQTGENSASSLIRDNILVLAIFFLILTLVILTTYQNVSKESYSYWHLAVHCCLALVAIAIASHLYCLKFKGWPGEAAAMMKQLNERVDSMVSKSKAVKTNEGVKL